MAALRRYFQSSILILASIEDINVISISFLGSLIVINLVKIIKIMPLMIILIELFRLIFVLQCCCHFSSLWTFIHIYIYIIFWIKYFLDVIYWLNYSKGQFLIFEKVDRHFSFKFCVQIKFNKNPSIGSNGSGCQPKTLTCSRTEVRVLCCNPSPKSLYQKIGRASCRERV